MMRFTTADGAGTMNGLTLKAQTISSQSPIVRPTPSTASAQRGILRTALALPSLPWRARRAYQPRWGKVNRGGVMVHQRGEYSEATPASLLAPLAKRPVIEACLTRCGYAV